MRKHECCWLDLSLRWLALSALILAAIASGNTQRAAAQSSPATIITGTATAKDGDSVWMGTGRAKFEVRLHGVDAPENDQTCKDHTGKPWPCGTDATKVLASLVNGHRLQCEVTDVDKIRAGRPIVRCVVDSLNVSEEMIRRGMAWAFDRYLKDHDDYEALKKLEAVAKANGLGVWKGEAEPPWDFRERLWDRFAALAPNRCPIIGNEKSRIYYTPRSRGYQRMFNAFIASPNAKGKQWLCDEAQAIEKGFRLRR